MSAGIIGVLAYLPTLWVRGVCAKMLWSASLAVNSAGRDLTDFVGPREARIFFYTAVDTSIARNANGDSRHCPEQRKNMTQSCSKSEKKIALRAMVKRYGVTVP